VNAATEEYYAGTEVQQHLAVIWVQFQKYMEQLGLWAAVDCVCTVAGPLALLC